MNSVGNIKKQTGFTIVELLIVIVVIGILAAITIVAYNGVQQRARDTLRTDTIAQIVDALEVYKSENGQYPVATANPGASSWETSNDVPGTFLNDLEGLGFSSTKSVDPINNNTYRFYYYRYGAGSGGCDAARGGFYVLRLTYESASNKPKGKTMTGDCSTPQASWSDTTGTAYATHAYENY